MLIKALLVFLLIAAVETGHGILRARFLAPRVGDFRSRQMGVFSGSFLIYVISILTFDWMNPLNPLEAFTIGAYWTVSMFLFEMGLGHFVFRFPWKWLFNEFNLFKGRLLFIGMAFLLCSPYLAGQSLGRW